MALAFDSLLGMQNPGPFPRPTELKSAFEPDPQCTLKVKHLFDFDWLFNRKKKEDILVATHESSVRWMRGLQ